MPRINSEFFSTLPREKQEFIGSSYIAFQQGEITEDDFCALCEDTLTNEEYRRFFINSEQMTSINDDFPQVEYPNFHNSGNYQQQETDHYYTQQYGKIPNYSHHSAGSHLQYGGNPQQIKTSPQPNLKFTPQCNQDSVYRTPQMSSSPHLNQNHMHHPNGINQAKYNSVVPNYIPNGFNEPPSQLPISSNNLSNKFEHNSEESDHNQIYTNPRLMKESKNSAEIKTENIDDIMQYSGVDLKEEADKIVKDIEYNIDYSIDYATDITPDLGDLFNIPLFTKFINNCCANRNVKITEDGVGLIFKTMKRKLLNFMEKMDQASKIRANADLANLEFNIENEHSKQLWFLNEMEKNQRDVLKQHKDEDKVRKKIVQEREDLLIKKRQSNTVAMAAMGLKQKSWMKTDASKDDEINRFESIYSPFDERTVELNAKNRQITMKDFLYTLERDKRYNKSVFLISQYYKMQ